MNKFSKRNYIKLLRDFKKNGYSFKNCLNISKNSLYDAIQKYSFSLNSKILRADKLVKMEDIKEAYNNLKSETKI